MKTIKKLSESKNVSERKWKLNIGVNKEFEDLSETDDFDKDLVKNLTDKFLTFSGKVEAVVQESEFFKFEDLVTEIADAEDEDEFNSSLNFLYDWADDNDIFIDTMGFNESKGKAKLNEGGGAGISLKMGGTVTVTGTASKSKTEIKTTEFTPGKTFDFEGYDDGMTDVCTKDMFDAGFGEPKLEIPKEFFEDDSDHEFELIVDVEINMVIFSGYIRGQIEQGYTLVDAKHIGAEDITVYIDNTDQDGYGIDVDGVMPDLVATKRFEEFYGDVFNMEFDGDEDEAQFRYYELCGEYKYNKDSSEKFDPKNVDKGKMHKLLGIDPSRKISDEFSSGEELAKALRSKVSKAKAMHMLNFVANINPEINLFDDAVEALKKMSESKSSEIDKILGFVEEKMESQRIGVSIKELENGTYQIKTDEGFGRLLQNLRTAFPEHSFSSENDTEINIMVGEAVLESEQIEPDDHQEIEICEFSIEGAKPNIISNFGVSIERHDGTSEELTPEVLTVTASRYNMMSISFVAQLLGITKLPKLGTKKNTIKTDKDATVKDVPAENTPIKDQDIPKEDNNSLKNQTLKLIPTFEDFCEK